MTDLEFEQFRAIVRTELADMRADLRALRPLADGFPLMQCTVTVIQQEVRSLKAAITSAAA
jgi:hypothetical protein